MAIIRKASKNDLPDILQFAKEMINFHRQLDDYYKSPESFENLNKEFERDFEDKNSLFLVAEIRGEVIGYFRGAIEPAPAYAAPKKIGVVYDLFVKEGFRNQGIGGKLMQEALGWFKSKNIKNIELSVDARNTGAISFWKNFGFFEYKLKMRRDS